MRFYSFTNFYLSSVQQGIQPAHCIADLFVKYRSDTPDRAVLFDWAENHKTMICLGGVNAQGVREVFVQLCEIGDELGLPFGSFHEDQASLDGTMTCCGIVVPTHIYEAAANLRTARRDSVTEIMAASDGLNNTELALADILNQYPLAR